MAAIQQPTLLSKDQSTIWLNEEDLDLEVAMPTPATLTGEAEQEWSVAKINDVELHEELLTCTIVARLSPVHYVAWFDIKLESLSVNQFRIPICYFVLFKRIRAEVI